MRPFFSFSAFSCRLLLPAIGCLSLLNTHADPLTDEQLAAILKELNEIEELVEGNRISTRTSAVEMFREAASSDKAAYEFYLRCVKLLRFDEKDSRYSDYRDWREKNEDKLKDDSNLTAIRLQLQYLVLSLRAAEGVDRETIVPELESFLASIVANVEELQGRGWQTLREPVNRTVFAEAFELNQSLQVEDWNYSPGRFGDCYEKTIFPYMRAEAPSELAAAWDRRIGLEKQYVAITEEDNETALEKFQTERLPRLFWQKGTDVYVHVSQSQGAVSLIQLLRQNADHPDATKWLKSLKELLSVQATPEN